ncbi:hypothetical protein HJC23_000443, partial [Cyclotella cryptica]
IKEAKKASVDQNKFLGVDKNKFGIKFQAVGASADCLAFEANDLQHPLKDGLMKKDSDKEMFGLFSDNAHLNTSYTATLFPYTSGIPEMKSKDNYNFYHSYLCIRI